MLLFTTEYVSLLNLTFKLLIVVLIVTSADPSKSTEPITAPDNDIVLLFSSFSASLARSACCAPEILSL